MQPKQIMRTGLEHHMSDTLPPRLFAPQEPIFPRKVRGFYRNLKWWILAVTLGIYYLTPWLRWDRGPALPDQAVLVDLAHRRFYFFMIEIWPHEFYFVAGLLIMAGLGLFLFTSALGAFGAVMPVRRRCGRIFLYWWSAGLRATETPAYVCGKARGTFANGGFV